jgi:tellurite resistance protein TerC
METSWISWVTFNIAFLIAIVVDLFYHNRNPHKQTTKHHIRLSCFWIGTALAFNLSLYFSHGPSAALDFLAGYLIEKSLSVDNLFIFLLIFKYFQTPKQYVHKVLFYGILGAIVMRALCIFGGIALVQEFHYTIYIMAVFLIFAGIKMFIKGEEEIHPENNPVLIAMSRWVPFTNSYHDGKFFISKNGKRLATPLFAALLLIEVTDVVFALDSIPAILAITLDPYIVYTSNVLAILGLRSLYFSLSTFLELFHYLYLALGTILTFVGTKMLLSPFFHVPTWFSLLFIVLCLSTSFILSLLNPRPPKPKSKS